MEFSWHEQIKSSVLIQIFNEDIYTEAQKEINLKLKKEIKSYKRDTLPKENNYFKFISKLTNLDFDKLEKNFNEINIKINEALDFENNNNNNNIKNEKLNKENNYDQTFSSISEEEYDMNVKYYI